MTDEQQRRTSYSITWSHLEHISVQVLAHLEQSAQGELKLEQRWSVEQKVQTQQRRHSLVHAKNWAFCALYTPSVGGRTPRGVLCNFYTYVGSGYFLGSKFWISVFLGVFRKMNIFLGMKILWKFFGVTTKLTFI